MRDGCTDGARATADSWARSSRATTGTRTSFPTRSARRSECPTFSFLRTRGRRASSSTTTTTTTTPDDSRDLPSDESARQVDVVKDWKARGKFIYITLDDGHRKRRVGSDDAEGSDDDDDDDDDFLRSVWITLGMSGRFVSESALKTDKGGGRGKAGPRWYLEFLDPSSGRTRRIYYLDPRNFGTLRFTLSRSELDAKLRKLGPDILDDDIDDDAFLERMANGRGRPLLNVCKFLMDQTKIAGVGNYILAEGLYRASIDPFARLGELSGVQRRTLIRELRDVARTSYGAQGLSRPGGSYRDAEGKRGKFEFELRCYGRDYCAEGRPVLRETDGPHGRTIWYVEDQLFVPRWARNEDGSRMDDGEREEAATLAVSARDLSSGGGGGGGSEGEGDKGVTASAGTTDDAVADLLRGLTDPSWTEALSGYAQTDDFRSLAEFVASERASGAEVYPPEGDVFAALNLCPLDRVRAVVVGQDPYHGPGQGHGLAFSVRRGVPPPPSLRNIFREAADDVGIPPPRHGCLDSWAGQGVLLLNAALTVRRGEANSHAGKGWERFTDEVIRLVNDNAPDGTIFLLWGGPAQKKGSRVDGGRHGVIRTSHPSPLGATKTASPFLGSRCFGRANKALEKAGREPIDWTVR